MKIGIVGGSGFIGKYLIAGLHSDHDISIFTRQSQLSDDVKSIDNLQVYGKQDYQQDSLNSLFREHDVIINLVGILNERGRSGKGFHQAHVELSNRIVKACQHNNIGRYLHMSALHADAEKGPSHYQRSKGMAEDAVHAQHSDNFAVTSFRPSVIFGAGDSFCNRFAALLKLVPFVFPLARAQARFAPVYAGDVAQAFVNAIDDQSSYNQRINLCGPDIYTLGEIVELTAGALGKKIKVIGLPDSLAYMQAVFMDYCVPGKPFSIDNYNSLKVDSICESAPLGSTKLEDKVATYLHLPIETQIKHIMKL